MVELWIYLDDDNGTEQKFVWQFTPVNAGDDGFGELSWDILRNDKTRATGSDSSQAFWIKEIRDLVVGAGTLLNDDHHANFHRLIVAKRILWKRKIKNLDVLIEFSLKMDQSVVYEFLKDKRSLKKKTIKLIETQANWCNSFVTFLKERLEIG